MAQAGADESADHLIGLKNRDRLRAAGGIFLASVGWFCGSICERQYRLRFRIQPAATAGDGSKVGVEGTTDQASKDAAQALLATLKQRLS